MPSTTSTTSITLGFKPTFVKIVANTGSNVNYYFEMTYCSSISSSTLYVASHVTSTAMSKDSLPNSTNNRIDSIDSNGFTLNKWTASAINDFGTVYYIAGK